MDKSKTEHHLSHPKYRPDIDGLRAIAVLAVVFFHAFPTHLKGGFIGVDVFFVISGYLITSIIVSSIEKNSFSFIEFYERRIRRIFPALLLVIISCLFAGWLILLSDEYKQLGRHALAGSAFISNFALRQESGYFDNAGETKPLLHLWSLGVEEQFYIIWPLLLFAAIRTRVSPLFTVVALGCLSFSLNVYSVKIEPAYTFYSPQTRFWELLVGSFLACIHQRHLGASRKLFISAQTIRISKEMLSAVGMAFLLLGLLRISEDRPFPGKWALLPTLGTAFIIAAGPRAWINKRILSSKPLVWIGLISFPLYLWHWPLLSYSYIIEGQVPPREMRALMVALSFALAFSTYRLIERPLRLRYQNRKTTLLLVSIMLAIAAFSYSIVRSEGYAFRLGDKQQFSDFYKNDFPGWPYVSRENILEAYNNDCNFYNVGALIAGRATKIPLGSIPDKCFARDNEKRNSVFLWGDSHAQHLFYGLRKNLPSSWQIQQVASSACAANPDAKTSSSKDFCEQSNWFAMEEIKKTRPDVVLVAQDHGHSIGAMEKIEIKLRSLGIQHIIFVGPTPHWKADLNKIVLKKLWTDTPKRTLEGLNLDVIELNSGLSNSFDLEGASFANVIDALCDPKGCQTYIGDDKKTGLTSWDNGHLTPIASDYVARKLLVKMITSF